jgi:hypothetical protein
MIETTVSTETLNGNSISLPPGTVVGYRANGKPIYNIAGGDGRVEVDDDVDDDDDDDVDEHDDSDDVEDKWVPPSKEEFEKILAAKSKADSEAAARKRFLREAGLDPKTGKPVSKPKVKFDLGLDDDENDDDDDDLEVDQRKGRKSDVSPNSTQLDPKKIQRELDRQLEREVARTEQRERDRALTLLVAVPEALEDAGFNPKNLKRALKLLDLDSVSVDSDGEIEGLNEQIDELKADFPEFFKRTRMKDAAREVADTKTVGGGKKAAPASEENLDFATRLRNQLYGPRG